MSAIIYKQAGSPKDFEDGRRLFREYAVSLGVDLSFQDFEQELDMIGRQYAPPGGALILALSNSNAVGCTGIRQLDSTTAELKRMYVQSACRGKRIGLGLLEQAIAVARQLGYRSIRLDTLKDMRKAQVLYRSFGFNEIPAYRYNPLEGTVYMEKIL